MFDPIDFDPALVSAWPVGAGGMPVAAALADPARDADARRATERILLETKAAPDPIASLQDLLNRMTDEMKLQFEAFRRMRVEAERQLESPSDEAAVKLAKADIKAATDALSLIVRTIEKIDSLQRNLADDRERTAGDTMDQAAYDALVAGIERKIEARAQELAAVLAARAQDDGGAVTGRGPPAGA